MNFLSPVSLLELVLVLAILAYMGRHYLAQRKGLNALRENMQRERAALEAARGHITQGRAQSKPAVETLALVSQATADTALGRRKQLLVRGRARRSDGSLSEASVVLSEAEASRSQAATEDARFWSGAFVFIGLIGTLLCLGAAVGFLMFTIHSSQASRNFGEEVRSNMTGTFMSMGLAFFCTGAGALLTVALSGQVGACEKDVEALRLDIEEFSLLDLEPLVEASVDAVLNPSTAPTAIEALDASVARMEGLATQLTQALAAAEANFKQLSGAASSGAKQLGDAASGLAQASAHMQGHASGLGKSLGDLGQIVERHGRSQTTFISNVEATLKWLEAAVNSANTAFSGLSRMNEEFRQENLAARTSQAEILDRLQQQGKESSDRGQRIFHELKQESIAALGAIEGQIRASNEREEQTAKALREAIRTLADYAAHVEDMLRQMPAALGSEPIIAFESGHADAMAQLSKALSGVSGELSGLRGDVQSTLGGTGAAIQSVGGKVSGVHDDLRKIASQGGALSTVQANVSGLNDQVGALSGQVTQLKKAVGQIEGSIIIPIKRGGQG